MRPEIESPETRDVWQNYFTRVAEVLHPLPVSEGEDIRQELETHVLEILAELDMPPSQALPLALERLGEPEDYLAPIVGDRLIDRASEKKSPRSIAKALIYSAGRRLRSFASITFFGFGYFLAFVLAGVALLKPVFPEQVGLFQRLDGVLVLGGSTDLASGTQDIMGFWIVPVGLIVASIIYFALTKSLKYLRTSRSRPDISSKLISGDLS